MDINVLNLKEGKNERQVKTTGNGLPNGIISIR